MKIVVIEAGWINDLKYCEYCSSTDHNKTYLPFHKNVLNPEHICEDCAKDERYEILTKFNDRSDYFLELDKLKRE